MTRHSITAAILATTLLAAGCGKGTPSPGPTFSDVPPESPTADTPDTPGLTITTGASHAASGPCPFTASRNKEWSAEVDRTPPIPEGGRPLAIRGKVEVVEDGQSATLFPGTVDKAGQHFTLELMPNPDSTKGWRQISTGAYPAPEGVTKAIVDCGGAVLAEVKVETVH